MFLTEPLVLTLSLLSGFSDALIFMFIQSLTLVYKQCILAVDLSLIAIGVGHAIAWALFTLPLEVARKNAGPNPMMKGRNTSPDLWWLLYTAPCLPIGLIGFAWTSLGPPIHLIG